MIAAKERKLCLLMEKRKPLADPEVVRTGSLDPPGKLQVVIGVLRNTGSRERFVRPSVKNVD